MPTTLENITDLDRLQEVRRFYVHGAHPVGSRIQLLLSARFPGRFYGFLSDRPTEARHPHSAHTIRAWKTVLPHLGPGDFVFLTEGIHPEMKAGLEAQGVRHGQPFNVTSVYETYETPTFLHFCKTYLEERGGVALDLGGNTGLTGAMLATYCDHVYIFEANPELEPVIRATNRGNANITILMKAVDRHSGSITLYSAGTNNMSAVAKDKSGAVTVPSISVDDFCRMSTVAPSMIKVDVEGMDAEVLLGARQTLETHRPLIFFEHPLCNAGTYDTDTAQAEACLTFLSHHYDLLAYPTLDQDFPADAMGAPLDTFRERFTHLPVNVAAIPKR